MNLGLRPAREDEQPRLFALHREAMGRYIELAWGSWDDEVQYGLFRQRFETGRMRVLEVDGETAGILELTRKDNCVGVANIEIARPYRRRGIGSALLKEIQRQARKDGNQVRLQVLRTNPAQRLYRRLGFQVTGESSTHYFMEWSPLSRQATRPASAPAQR